MKKYALLIGLLVLAPTSSLAQYNYPDMMAMNIDFGNLSLEQQRMNSMLDTSGESEDGDNSNHNVRPSPPAKQYRAADFTFRPSTARRQENMQRFAASLRRNDPNGGAAFADLVARTDVVAAIGQSMRPVGLSVNNTADAFAVYWIAAWEAVHNKDMGASPLMYRAVSAQAANMLGPVSELNNASDATKQEIAESFLVQAGLIIQGKETWASDRKQQAALARAVSQGARKIGLDLNSMTLTQDGFAPRSGGRSDAGDAAGDDSQLAANDDGAQAEGASMGDYALYAVAGTGLLAGMFALGKGFSKKG